METLDQLMVSSQGSDEWKCILIKLFTEVLSNPSKIENLPQDTFDTSFSFIKNVAANYPELFVCNINDSMPSPQTEFTKWLFQHCLKVVCISFNLRNHIKNTFILFLNITKRDNALQFQSFLGALLDTLQKLISLLQNYMDNDVNEFPLQLEAFCIDAQCSESLTDVCICVQNCDSCLHLISLIISIFEEMIIHTPLIPSNLYKPLQKCTLAAITYGHLPLKMTGLQFLVKLLQTHTWTVWDLESYVLIFEACVLSFHHTSLEEDGSLFEEVVSSLIDAVVNYNDITPFDKLQVLHRLQTSLQCVMADDDVIKYMTSQTLLTAVLNAYKTTAILMPVDGASMRAKTVVGRQLLTHVTNNINTPLRASLKKAICQFLFDLVQLEHRTTSQHACVEKSFLEMESKGGVCDEVIGMMMEGVSEVEEMLHLGTIIPGKYLKILGNLSLLLDIVTYSTISHHLFLSQECPRMLGVLVRSMADLDEELTVQAFAVVSNIISTMLYISDSYEFDVEFCHTLLAVASLPWICTEMSLRDLKVGGADTFARISGHLHKNLDVEVISRCAHVLSALGKPHLAQQWRGLVITKIWAEGSTGMKGVVVRNIVFIMHRISTLQHDFLVDVVKSCVEEGELQKELACISGDLVCSLSSQATLVRKSLDPCAVLPPFDQTYQLLCQQCSLSSQIEHKNTPASTFIPPSHTTTTTILTSLLQLLSSPHVNVKIALINNFRPIFYHIFALEATKETSDSMMTKWIVGAVSLITNMEHAVRHAFSQQVLHLVPTSEDLQDVVDKRISSWLDESIIVSSLPHDVLSTAISTLANLCKGMQGRVLVTSLSILLNVVLFPASVALQALAQDAIKEIADHGQISCKELFKKHEKDICKALAQCAYETLSIKTEWTPRQMLASIASIFHFNDFSVFLKNIEHLFLPHLVCKSDATAATLIKFYANFSNENYRTLLVRNMGAIFCHLIINEHQRFSSFSFLERETGLSLVELLRSSSHVDGQLLIYLSQAFDPVLQGVKIYMSSKGLIEGTPDISNDALVDRLHGNLLGILWNFDKHLNSPYVALNLKIIAFESLCSLMQLVKGDQVTRYRMRIMKTLKIGLQLKGRKFGEVCLKAWDIYVKSLQVSALGGMLSQIVVCLLPFLPLHPAQVNNILTYLVIQNKGKLCNYLSDLYFVPQHHQLIKVNNVLKGYVDLSDKEFCKQLEHVLKGVTHDCNEVRVMALEKLKQLLKQNKDGLNELILSKETCHPVICRTIRLLLQCCREPSMRTLVGQCIGLLGAIDPARLDIKFPPNSSTFQNMESISFGRTLIIEMCKAFLRVEDSIQDCAAYAIQELMKVYSLNENNLKDFSEDVIEILTPLLYSRYKMTMASEPGEGVIYGGKKGKTFEKWACTLTGCLASKLNDPTLKSIYGACFGILKNDSQISLFLLPHFALQVILQNSQPYVDMLVEEMLTVLNDCSTNQPRKQDNKQDSTCDVLSDIRHLASQTVFSLLDYLERCFRHFKTEASRSSGGNKGGEDSNANETKWGLLKAFLARIPQRLLATAAHHCAFYSRSLLHYETHIRNSSIDLSADPTSMAFLSELYICLEEPDGVAGLMALQQQPPSSSQQILAFESVGKLSDASACYDHAMVGRAKGDLSLIKGLLHNRLLHGQLNSALHLASGFIADDESCGQELNRYRVEATWKLGQWQSLEKYLCQEVHVFEWNVSMGKILHSIKTKDQAMFKETLSAQRLRQMVPLSGISLDTGSYEQAYENIVRLHVLSDLEENESCFFNQHLPSVDLWNSRLKFCQSSYKSMSPILNVHRVLLQLLRDERRLDVEGHISQYWLTSAQVAREGGLLQTAHSCLLNAGKHNVFEYCIEKSKWLWSRGEWEESMRCLQKTYRLFISDISKLNNHDKHLLGKLALQMMHYNKETNSLEFCKMIEVMRNVKQLNPKSEETYFQIAKYYDKVYTNLDENSSKSKSMVHAVVNSYLMSLVHGSEHIHQSLSRSFTLWLDYSAQASKQDPVVDKLNKLMNNARQNLSAGQFLVVLPQLVSRICHQRLDVFNLLKDIVVKVMKHYRHQAFWSMVAVSKSSYQMRDKRCHEILQTAKSMYPELNKYLQDAMKLVDGLIDLCNKQVSNGNSLSMTQHFKPLIRMLNDQDFSEVMLPIQIQMNSPTTSTKPIFISSIEDKVEILHSLQKPKKVTFRGSDGGKYVMLCKPKDDLRKDCRLMESMSFVNRCLWRRPDSRQRNLHIRTFMVTPLDEDCGMLEWVDNTMGLRPIILNLYKQRNIVVTGRELRTMQVGVKEPLEKKLKVFKECLLPRHPAVFHEWFLSTFPHPVSWYNARQRYCRTTAVMSMAGFILGLGDRHGENILFDSTCGDCVHVDFSCLFNKGEEFEYPEVVPFRLTHNLVDAMGPLEHEGVFRKACEVTMHIMRQELDPLMSILKTFIFDPLVEWKKPAGGRNNPKESGEIKNEQAQTHMSKIESRLRGSLINNSVGLPLSVEGVVSSLIKEARDEENLCRMYIGWAAYM